MELRQLEAFVAVATELHFGRAAERLHVSAPTLSELIRRLERELGTPLFTRTTRRVAMTSAGEELLARAKLILDEVAAAAAAVRRVAGGDAGTVRLGITPAGAPGLGPHLIRRFAAQAPQVTVDVQRMWLPTMTEALVSGRIDVAITCGLIPAPEGVANEVFCAEPLLVGLRPDHRLAGQDTVALRDLAHDVLGMPPEDLFPAWTLAQRQALESAGISPPMVELADTDLAAARWADQADAEWSSRLDDEVTARMWAMIAAAGDNPGDQAAESAGDPGEAGEATGPEVWAAIRSDPGNVSLNTCKTERRKLDWIRAVGLPAGLLSDMAPKIVAGWRARVAVEAPSHLRNDHPDDGCWTLMAAYLHCREREITDSLVELLIATVHRINAPAETRTRDQFVSEIARKVTGKENILFKIAAAASERRTASSRRWCNRRPAGWRCCWTWCASSSRRGRPTGRPGSGASRPPTPTTTGSGWSRSWRRWSSGRTTRCTGRCWRRWS